MQAPKNSKQQSVIASAASVANSSGSFGKNVFGAQAFLDLTLANSWQQTLGKFALLQLMLYPLAFKLLYPINVKETSKVALETAAMDIFPGIEVQKDLF